MFGPLDAGYTIPAGWGVMVCPPAVHLNPEIYEDPLAFNPWRWQVCALFYLCKTQINSMHIYSSMLLKVIIRVLGEYVENGIKINDPIYIITLLVSVFQDFFV